MAAAKSGMFRPSTAMLEIRQILFCVIVVAALGTTGAAAQTGDAPLTRPQAYARAAALAALGRALFADPTLSTSGRMACASCHDPSRAFGPPNALPVQFGGKELQAPGIRAVPSLRYLQAVPQFNAHYYESDDEGDDSIDNGPTGGLTWDGRVDRDRDQASFPLLSSYEMANENTAEVVLAVRHGPHAGEFRTIFGDNIFDDTAKAFARIGEALEAFQQDYREFYPYSSKYDAYLAGRATLTAQEARGLALFDDPAKGNCGNCHRSQPGKDGTPPQFTDYGLIAIGVPRNRAIPANADPAFFDLGACGPLRSDLAGQSDYCGRFVTPSLRNVALRQSFFHNGTVHSLQKAVAFYVERDTAPERWYPRDPAGQIQKFDDLPEPYRANINMEPPFGGKPGGPPLLSADDISDLIAFLNTLTDGYQGP
jgi:cytochrome c peroxidase